MRRANLSVALLTIFAALPFSAQQAGSGPQDNQQTPPAVTRAPHSTEADNAIPLCPANLGDSLETDGIATGHDKSVSIPKPRNHVIIPEMSDEARRVGRERQIYDFKVGLSMILDVNGNPQSICIRRSAGYGLDAAAAESASKWQFVPAKKGDKPVPFRLTTVITFRQN